MTYIGLANLKYMNQIYYIILKYILHMTMAADCNTTTDQFHAKVKLTMKKKTKVKGLKAHMTI